MSAQCAVKRNSNWPYLSGTGASAPGAGGASPGRPPRAAASIRAIAGSIVAGIGGFKERPNVEDA